MVSSEADHRNKEGNSTSQSLISEELNSMASGSSFLNITAKALENTQVEAEKKGPEMRQQEWELERQKQERARLQEDVSIAKELRQQEEARAAAEAKRKIELERAASRQALQELEEKMAKRYGSAQLVDMLVQGTASLQELSSSATEMNPSLDLKKNVEITISGNPLEQHDLYTNNDEDERQDDETMEGQINRPSPDLRQPLNFKLTIRSKPQGQPALYMTKDDEIMEGEINRPSPDLQRAEMNPSLGLHENAKLTTSGEPQGQVGLYMKKEDEEDEDESGISWPSSDMIRLPSLP